MSDFLLIHGSCHGAWCWDDLIPHLTAAGHSARAIDLPSHGQDRTAAGEVTLDLYARAIVAAIDRPVILVGHSMAGYPITAAAGLAPDKISALVYLCAYVPMAGKSLAQMRRMAPTQPLLDAIIVDEARMTFRVDPAKAAGKFYHDVPPTRAAWAIGQLGPQPILPQETPLVPNHSLPRHYLRCTDDRTIPPEFQTTMTADWPAGTVTDLPTSHSPFLSDPALLAQHLDRIARIG
ncbi:alpha/beta fold hydrolase [Yoonia vestfoldensis]|jgi:pimeloyl-ACP methyl ester carboxylesterase|uniref:Pyrethroid hydrolase n=1 Tax=Yoonia vestfoldensis TaxID=245188 RepID=A0A1Y0ED54_9RHOB|nr:alpha/beta fold hydrolase [Yoonia vestfoldensis]ARU01545.1 pyrethroid hydrolase [Yoonia vestfoldensis]